MQCRSHRVRTWLLPFGHTLKVINHDSQLPSCRRLNCLIPNLHLESTKHTSLKRILQPSEVLLPNRIPSESSLVQVEMNQLVISAVISSHSSPSQCRASGPRLVHARLRLLRQERRDHTCGAEASQCMKNGTNERELVHVRCCEVKLKLVPPDV